MGSVALRIEDLPHYTYDDYVKWEGRWELIHGIPYAMVPAPTVKHQRLSVKIAHQLETLLTNCGTCRTLMPVDWQIDEYIVVQPDVLVVCGADIEGEKLLIPPVLVFEILSPSTVRKDRIIKYQLYEVAGVKYYCLVDPETSSAEVFELKDKNYRKIGTFENDNVEFDIGECTIAFDFSKVFTDG